MIVGRGDDHDKKDDDAGEPGAATLHHPTLHRPTLHCTTLPCPVCRTGGRRTGCCSVRWPPSPVWWKRRGMTNVPWATWAMHCSRW